MRKLISSIMLLFVPLMLFWGMEISADAMTKEEKELLDSLGIEYNVDENGDFKEFVVSETSSRFPTERLFELAKQYDAYSSTPLSKEVGRYWVYGVINEEGTTAEFHIIDEESNISIFTGYPDLTCYNDSQNNFFALHYEDMNSEEPYCYGKGNHTLDENGRHPFEEYYRNESGEFVISVKRDDERLYKFDENGQLKYSEEYATNIIYDADGKAIKKTLYPASYYEALNETDSENRTESDSSSEPSFEVSNVSLGFGLVVPIEVADEVQAIMDKNGGNWYSETGEINLEILEVIHTAEEAKELGMDLQEYKEKKENVNYTEVIQSNGGNLSLVAKKELLGIPQEHLLNAVEMVEEENVSEDISKEQIAKELFNIINEYRIENGIEPLDNSDVLLQKVADIRAEESCYIMDAAHSRPLVGNASSLGVGENLANFSLSLTMTSKDIAQNIFEAWKSSSGHNKNMLNTDYTQGNLGVSFIKGENGLRVIVSHDFNIGNYSETINETIEKMIEAGAQVPGKNDSIEEYYNKVLGNSITKPKEEKKAEYSMALGTITEEEFNSGVLFNMMLVTDDGNDEYAQSVIAAVHSQMQSFGYSEGRGGRMLGRSHPIRFGTDVQAAADSIVSDMFGIMFSGGTCYEFTYVRKAANGYVFDFQVEKVN